MYININNLEQLNQLRDLLFSYCKIRCVFPLWGKDDDYEIFSNQLIARCMMELPTQENPKTSKDFIEDVISKVRFVSMEQKDTLVEVTNISFHFHLILMLNIYYIPPIFLPLFSLSIFLTNL